MKLSRANILFQITLFVFISLVGADADHHEDSPYNHQQLPTDQHVYIKKMFKYVPEKDNWQQKFAETISRAIEDDKGEEFAHPRQENTLQKESDLYNFHNGAPEVPQIYEKPPQVHISADLDPHVAGSRTDAGYANESSTQKPEILGAKPNLLHIPTYHSGQQFADNEKGEILIHRPAPIVVNRPPTKVLVNHPPLIVKPAPVIFHRPPSVIVRQVFVKPKQEPVKMQPVYVKVIKPAPEKIYIKEHMEHISCGDKKYDTDYEQKQHYYPSQYNY